MTLALKRNDSIIDSKAIKKILSQLNIKCISSWSNMSPMVLWRPIINLFYLKSLDSFMCVDISLITSICLFEYVCQIYLTILLSGNCMTSDDMVLQFKLCFMSGSTQMPSLLPNICKFIVYINEYFKSHSHSIWWRHFWNKYLVKHWRNPPLPFTFVLEILTHFDIIERT